MMNEKEQDNLKRGAGVIDINIACICERGGVAEEKNIQRRKENISYEKA